MRKKPLVFALFLLLLFSTSVYTSTAETAGRDSSYTTAKGTIFTINSTIEHAGLVESKPTFLVNATYVLQVSITIEELGVEVEDFHDITFEISIVSDSLIGSDLSFYHGYFFDSETRLEAGDNKVYSFDMFIAGDKNQKDATLKVIVTGKENVPDNRDPTSEFDAALMECIINPGEVATTASGLVGDEVLEKSMEVYADKGTKVRFEMLIDYDGKNNESAKPRLASLSKYLIRFNVTVLELGPEARDFHDISIRVKVEDTSILDIVPGNTATKYYEAGLDDTETKLLTGDSATYSLVLYISTNINNTEVTMSVEFKGKEDLSNKIDPTSEFDLNIEFIINEGVSNIFDALRSETDGLNFPFPFLFLLIAVPILRKAKK